MACRLLGGSFSRSFSRSFRRARLVCDIFTPSKTQTLPLVSDGAIEALSALKEVQPLSRFAQVERLSANAEINRVNE